jgi:hypothetical protein
VISELQAKSGKAAAMKNANSWISRAEEYCRAKGAEKIRHPTKKHLYDLQGVVDEVRIALFDQDGFLIIRRGDLHGAWGDGYFPSGIKAYDSYLTRSGFEKSHPPSEK